MRRAASPGDSWKMRWDEGSIQPRECTSTRDGSRAPIWSHGAAGSMWPIRTFFGSPASVTIRNAERQTPPTGISVILNAAVSRDLLKRANRRFVVIVSPRGPMVRAGFQDLPIPGRGRGSGSRSVVRGVVRLGRQALPRPDGPHDLAQEVRRHRLEARVLRRPEGAALGRGPDRGCEAEHLGDGRLRVDHRDLALLADVLDHAAAALDLPDRGTHEVLRDVDEDLLDRLEQDAARPDHAECLECLREDRRVLDPLPGRDFARPDRLDHLLFERLDLHVESIVHVWRLPLEGTALSADALPVHDDRRARRHGDLVIVLDPVDRDLEVQLPHAGDQVFSRLLIDLDLDARVRLRD